MTHSPVYPLAPQRTFVNALDHDRSSTRSFVPPFPFPAAHLLIQPAQESKISSRPRMASSYPQEFVDFLSRYDLPPISYNAHKSSSSTASASQRMILNVHLRNQASVAVVHDTELLGKIYGPEKVFPLPRLPYLGSDPYTNLIDGSLVMGRQKCSRPADGEAGLQETVTTMITNAAQLLATKSGCADVIPRVWTLTSIGKIRPDHVLQTETELEHHQIKGADRPGLTLPSKQNVNWC